MNTTVVMKKCSNGYYIENVAGDVYIFKTKEELLEWLKKWLP
jgi:hypothetical protein